MELPHPGALGAGGGPVPLITSGIGVQFAHRALLASGALVLAASQLVLLLFVRDGADPSWALAAPLFMGGLGLGLTAPSLVNVVLAGVPARDAGAAGGVLTTVGQVGNALGVAVLGAMFFTWLESSFTDGGTGLVAYGDAFTMILPWQVACYVAAALMLLLPRRANAPHE